jgi:hypothetical protein
VSLANKAEPAAWPTGHRSRSRIRSNVRTSIAKTDRAWAYLFHQRLQGAFGVREKDRIARLFKQTKFGFHDE